MRRQAPLQPWIRRMAYGHAGTRLAIGIGLLAAPSAGAAWLGPDVERGGGRVALQAFAIREAAMGAGLLYALRRGLPVRHWFALGTAFEAVDALATMRDRRSLPDGWVPDAVSLFALSGIPGGAAVAFLLED